MKYLIAFLFTVICKPGNIICGDGSQTVLAGTDNSYYYFEEVELKDGSYCYVSINSDTTWFYVEQAKLYYTFPKQKRNNEQFEVIKN